jgi:chromosomal replication initiator protein
VSAELEHTELKHIWSRVQAELAGAVGEQTYRIWLEPLTVRELSHGRLSIEAPAQTCGWVRDRFGRVLRECAASILGDEVAVELTSSPGVHGEAEAEPSPDSRDPVESARGTTSRHGQDGSGARGSLRTVVSGARAGETTNPKLTFDQFVIGDSNHLAHAAALTVAELPAQAYNPLFICGPPGVGKTHLLSSIGNLLLTHSPGLAVRTTTGEAFTNEFLHALSGRQTDAFKARFRHIDVLLVDDVQFLERKTRTEEEFFHTFNALHDGGRQIVLTSDRPPHDLQALEDRLRERFQAGLVADIQPPDLATRMAILRKRSRHDELNLADDSALEPIAERIRDNVRALEGALIRVVAFSSLTSRPLTPELAREVLDGLYPAAQASTRHEPTSIDEIQAVACKHFGLTPDELLSASRASRVSWPRQVAMYLARELTGESFPAIARQFGRRDHTTVLHAHRRAAARIANDSSSRTTVNNLLDELQPHADRHTTPHHDRSA